MTRFYWHVPKDAAWRYQQTSLGEVIVCTCLSVVDAQPELLTAGIPVLLEDEVRHTLPSLPAEHRAGFLAQRVAAFKDEALLRQQDPQRTVWGMYWLKPKRQRQREAA